MLNLTLDVMPQTYSALGAAGTGDLKFWTAAELYANIGAAVEDLQRRALTGVQVLTFTTTAGVGTYALASAGQVLMVALASSALTPATATEMDALDPFWRSATGTPTRVVMETGGIRLTPAPTAAFDVLVVANVRAADPSEGSPNVALPVAMSPWAVLVGIAEARRRESRGAMPDVSEVAREIAKQFEAAAISYYGEGR